MATTASTWGPCRYHLMNLVFAISPAVLRGAHWRTTPRVWSQIKTDPQMKANWHDPYDGHTATLCGLPVHLNGRTDTIDLIIPADCDTTEKGQP